MYQHTCKFNLHNLLPSQLYMSPLTMFDIAIKWQSSQLSERYNSDRLLHICDYDQLAQYVQASVV